MTRQSPKAWFAAWLVLLLPTWLLAQEGTVPAFDLDGLADLRLTAPAQPFTPFDQCGRRFAILGAQSGRFEAWAYPLKLFRAFQMSFYIGASTRPIPAEEIVRRVEVTPAATTLVYTFQSFTVKAHYVTAVDTPGAVILLDIASTEPLSIVCGFLPVLQPMWPAGIGGQYAYWNGDLKAYLISETTRKNHGLVGSPCAAGLSYTPAHMLSDAPSEFRIDIPDPAAIRGRFIPLIMAGGKGAREDVIGAYKALMTDPQRVYKKAVAHHRALQERTLAIRTPVKSIDLALAWAKASYDGLVVDHPTLGTGLVAGLGASGTSGRPGFGWFFGGDTYINSLSLDSYGDYATVKKVLSFMVPFQRQDGKMAHEITQAVDDVDWFGDYPYAYIHGDTSPYFIVAVSDYVTSSGDTAFVRTNWETLRKAYDWSLATDQNGDGLMDNAAAGLGALEYGQLAGGIATDIYIGAVWTRAAQVMPRLARWAGQTEFADTAEKTARLAEKSFKEKFWDKDADVYAYAFGSDSSHVKAFSPWNAVGLMWGLGEPDRSAATLSRLASAELMTDWGVRSISNQSPYYEALNYNYGAVWPFLNSWVASALFRHGFLLQGYATLKATIDQVYRNQLGAVGEVFSGTLHAWPGEAVAHQGFSTAGTVLPLVRGLLGLEGDALGHTLRFAPQCPADWTDYAAKNVHIGGATFDLSVKRGDKALTVEVRSQSASGFTLELAPYFGPGTAIGQVWIDGVEAARRVHETDRFVQPMITVPIQSERHVVTVAFTPTVEVLPPVVQSEIGDESHGLRIRSVTRSGQVLALDCEGLAGWTYDLGVTQAGLIRKVDGASHKAGRLTIPFPPSDSGGYVRKTVTVTVE